MVKIRSVSDTRARGGGEPPTWFTKQKGARIKIRSVSDGTRMGVGPHAD
jgi:hypothetical protein